MGTALVTGASAGLGEEFAWQLATARHDLVLVARDAARLEALAVRLRAAAGVHVEVLPADLSVREDVARVAARLEADERPVGLLVNNAGYTVHQRFTRSDLDAQDALLEVMVRSVQALSYAAARAMKDRGRGAILNVSSVAAHTVSGTYSAAKAWVLAFTEGLAVELGGTGVTATALCPGLTRTEFHERAGFRRLGPGWFWLDRADVVRVALADVRRGAVVSVPSARYRVATTVARHLPRGAMRTLTKRAGL
ncbi:SDR family oxidoreductase [Sanguibacter sp. HDW7]|uniref:SDR family NAD(P)-dependent oxidoreductase n=1 Tax=Sanguibacter sp. HDW7 TaxID=2714931 RepID=UPI00140A767F|nr:SDR family NAD(P)-dependent oxidoreductase [Sanguibacter sp. HDW7]QIK84563.1 SDR family NAD(P)-dependent oxidoreductase [Sanguibacter sp. HDW7]